VLSTLYFLFFLSGCSALIYQVMWQRLLFTVFGVDINSITIVVSVFMFGLGLGGMAGGYLADAWPERALLLYVAIEVCIAMFGFFSPYIINTLGDTCAGSGHLVTVAASFLALAVPTLLMGATFPILVMYINRYKRNIGDSVGGLYFSNTLGGAMGAALSGFVLLYFVGIAGAVNAAAALNLIVAVVALGVFRR
jgi:predicted membrane-bound spermidine synthase